MGAVEGLVAGDMLGGSNDVPRPDGSIGVAAQKNMALGDEMAGVARDQLQWNKDQYEQLAPYFKKILDQQVDLGNLSADTAKQQWDHYQTTYLPVEQQLGKDAMNEGSAAQQEAEANQARSDIASQFEASREERGRDLAMRGINPASPAAMTGLSGANEAAAQAGAMNTARNNARLRGIQLRSNVAQLGRSVPATALSADANAVGAGSTAVNTGTAAMTAKNAGVASAAPWYAGAVNANTGGGNLGLGVYDANMRGYQAQAQQQAAMFQGLGQIGGMIGSAAILSSRGVKINKRPISAEKIAEKVKTLPVERWIYKDGAYELVGDKKGEQHVGPYAEDFKETFGVGDGKTIKVVDAIGVALAAVKGLAEKVDRVENMAARVARLGVAHA